MPETTYERLVNTLYCLPDDTILQGNWDTDEGKIVQIKFRYCEGKEYCKSKEEIDAWVSFNKQFYTIGNTWNYDDIEYDPEKVIKHKLRENYYIPKSGGYKIRVFAEFNDVAT